MIYYVAHPLGVGAARKENLARVKRWLAWLWKKHPTAVLCCPWPALAEVLPDDPEVHKRGLAMDLAILRRCDGIILCGASLTPGMLEELMTFAKESKFGYPTEPRVLNYVGSVEPPND